MPICKKCGAQIRYIKTTAGKNMPVDWSRQEYVMEDHGKERILLDDGRVISCRLPKYGEEATGTGFVPHFASCIKEVVE